MIKKCQVFTPPQIVVELLDSVGYISDLYGKSVIENACGDGNILSLIVKRYIEDSIHNKISIDEIKSGLERDIYGAEIDKKHHIKCLENLDNIASEYGIQNVKWRILNIDILEKNLELKFDFVIGNPPYITYRDLDGSTRNYLKENYEVCAYGKFDYCYAFIEASIKCLSDRGKLAYLIPSSIFKNVFSQELRNFILPFTSKIIDYTTIKLFEEALISSSILICEKGIIQDFIEYYDVANDKKYDIEKCSLIKKWIFSNKTKQNTHKKRFGDYFSASISVATLYNKAYVLKQYEVDENYIRVGDFRIERSIVREGVSPRSLNYKKKELIIFPYQYNNHKLIRYTSDEFEKQFIEVTKYLKSHSIRLSKRKADKSVQWFEYGRTQALAHLDQPKILLSTIVTNKVKVYELDKDCIPYSGIYIIPKSDLPLSRARDILESQQFYKYVQRIGINASGNSMRITAVDVNNYMF